jgi:hypothetical protein
MPVKRGCNTIGKSCPYDNPVVPAKAGTQGFHPLAPGPRFRAGVCGESNSAAASQPVQPKVQQPAARRSRKSPSPPFRGEREGPRRDSAWEGEVGSATNRCDRPLPPAAPSCGASTGTVPPHGSPGAALSPRPAGGEERRAGHQEQDWRQNFTVDFPRTVLRFRGDDEFMPSEDFLTASFAGATKKRRSESSV